MNIRKQLKFRSDCTEYIVITCRLKTTSNTLLFDVRNIDYADYESFKTSKAALYNQRSTRNPKRIMCIKQDGTYIFYNTSCWSKTFCWSKTT